MTRRCALLSLSLLLLSLSCSRGKASLTDGGPSNSEQRLVRAGIQAAREHPLTPDEALPERVEVLALRGALVAPGGSLPMRVGRPETVALVERVGLGGLVFALRLRNPEAAGASQAEFSEVGCLSRIVAIDPQAEERLVVLQGIRRARLISLVNRVASIEEYPDSHALSASHASRLWEAYRANGTRPAAASDADWHDFLRRIKDAPDLTFPVLVNLELPSEEQQRLFELRDADARADALLEVLAVPAALRRR